MAESLNHAPGRSSLLKVVRYSQYAQLPKRETPGAAGLDLFSAHEYTVPPAARCLIETDIGIQLPPGTYGRIAPRSGLALKHFIDIGAGVIDQDYRGTLKVLLFNLGTENFHVRRGDRIAQLICEKIEYPILVEVSGLDETERNSEGFGSTGI